MTIVMCFSGDCRLATEPATEKGKSKEQREEKKEPWPVTRLHLGAAA